MPQTSISQNNNKKSSSVFSDDQKKVKHSAFQSDPSEVSSSIYHAGDKRKKAKTSVFHDDVFENYNYYNNNDEERDNQRYEYIRKKLRENKNKETTKKQKQEEFASKLKTGGAFRTTGHKALRRKLYALRKKDRVHMGNLSPKDLQYFLDLIEPHFTVLKNGKRIPLPVKRKLKREVRWDRIDGKISRQDARDMKRMIDNFRV